MKYFCQATIKGVRDVIHNDKFTFYLLEEHSNICQTILALTTKENHKENPDISKSQNKSALEKSNVEEDNHKNIDIEKEKTVNKDTNTNKENNEKNENHDTKYIPKLSEQFQKKADICKSIKELNELILEETKKNSKRKRIYKNI